MGRYQETGQSEHNPHVQSPEAREAFERLFPTPQNIQGAMKLVEQYLLRIEQDHSIREDIVQATFLQAFRKADTFNGESNVKTWLCAIARNFLLERHRKNGRTAGYREGDVTLEQYSNISASAHYQLDPDILSMQNETVGDIYSVLDRVDVVLKLRAIDEKSAAEIAAELGTTEKAVKSRLHRARAEARRLLAGRGIAA